MYLGKTFRFKLKLICEQHVNVYDRFIYIFDY